jgi:PhoPQ-activated pathogenicity-related protein
MICAFHHRLIRSNFYIYSMMIIMSLCLYLISYVWTICQMKMSVNYWNLMKRKWISLVFFYCEVSNIHHPLWSCQIEVRSKGILVVSLIAFVMCERVDKNGHALTYTIVHWKSKIEQIMYRATDIQWSNEQISSYGFY